MRIAITLLALALATGACKKKETKPTGETTGSAATMTGSGSAAMAGSADMAGSAAMAGSAGSAAMAGSGDMAGSGAGAGSAMSGAEMAKHAGNCPSTVLNSTTKAEVKGKDVVVSITSTDKDAIAAIQKRTDEMLKIRMSAKKGAGSGEGSAGPHDQRGTHGGSIGLCPVHIPEGATAKAKHEKNGVTVTITPKDKPDALKTEIDARITKAAKWVEENIKPGDQGNQGGVGGVKNDEGANHSGKGDGKGKERKKSGAGAGSGGGGGEGTGGGGGKGTGGGGGSGSGAKKK